MIKYYKSEIIFIYIYINTLSVYVSQANDDGANDSAQCSEMHTELLKGKENMPILIPEAPVVNPNAALGTPPRLNSDGEADPEIEEILDASEGTDEGTCPHSFCEGFFFFLLYLVKSCCSRICYFDTKCSMIRQRIDGRNTNTRWIWRRILVTS